MFVLQIFLYVYLAIGTIYALYVWLFAGDPWWAIPINIIGGPIVLVHETVRALTEKRVEIKELFVGKKGVIFDLDGTIIDSQPFLNEAMEQVLGSLNATWLETNYPHGLNYKEKWEYLIKENPGVIDTKFTIEELTSRTKKRYIELYENVEPFTGFWTLAKYLKEKGFKLGMATNTDKDIAEIILKRLGAEENVFDFMIFGDQVKHKKPHPEIYQKALKGLGLRAHEVIAFEDTVVGSMSSTKAGIQTVIIWDGFDEEMAAFPKNTYLFISDFENLPDYIEKTSRELVEEAAKELEADLQTEQPMSGVTQ